MTFPNRKSTRIPDFDYSQHGTYFVTICTKNRQRILSTITKNEPPETVLLCHGEIADKTIRQMDAFYDSLSVEKYMIMPDHIHLLITIHAEQTKAPTIAQFVGTFKRFCNKEYGENIWQERYYDHVIRNEQDYNEVWEYIDNNPRKWVLTRDME